jgi:hypothetical protein
MKKIIINCSVVALSIGLAMPSPARAATIDFTVSSTDTSGFTYEQVTTASPIADTPQISTTGSLEGVVSAISARLAPQ